MIEMLLGMLVAWSLAVAVVLAVFVAAVDRLIERERAEDARRAGRDL